MCTRYIHAFLLVLFLNVSIILPSFGFQSQLFNDVGRPLLGRKSTGELTACDFLKPTFL